MQNQNMRERVKKQYLASDSETIHSLFNPSPTQNFPDPDASGPHFLAWPLSATLHEINHLLTQTPPRTSFSRSCHPSSNHTFPSSTIYWRRLSRTDFLALATFLDTIHFPIQPFNESIAFWTRPSVIRFSRSGHPSWSHAFLYYSSLYRIVMFLRVVCMSPCCLHVVSVLSPCCLPVVQ